MIWELDINLELIFIWNVFIAKKSPLWKVANTEKGGRKQNSSSLNLLSPPSHGTSLCIGSDVEKPSFAKYLHTYKHWSHVSFSLKYRGLFFAWYVFPKGQIWGLRFVFPNMIRVLWFIQTYACRHALPQIVIWPLLLY